jgi:hypothetical protein
MKLYKKNDKTTINSLLISAIVFLGLGQIIIPNISFLNLPCMFFILVLLLYLNINNVQKNIAVFNKSLIVVYLLVFYFFNKAFFGEFRIMEIYPFLLSLTFLLIFFRNENISLKKTFYISTIVILILCLILFFQTNASFISYFQQETYLIRYKNFIGPFLSSCILFFLFKKNKRGNDYLLLVPLLLVQAMLLSRTNLAFVLSVILLYLFFNITKDVNSKIKNIFSSIFLILLLLVIIIYFPNIIEGFAAADTEINDLSSNRWDILLHDIQYFINNPFFGIGFIDLEVHSILFYSLIAGGIVFFIIVISYIIVTYGKLIRLANDRPKIKSILISTFVLMLLEVQAPFGPGSSYILLWLLVSNNNE